MPHGDLLVLSVLAAVALVMLGALVIAARLLLGQSRSHRLAHVERAAGGASDALIVSLSVAAAAGVIFELALAWRGSALIVLPSSFTRGLLLGLGAGALIALALARLRALPGGIVIGTALGLAAGLAIFRLIFGPFAGFGNVTDHGVGTEVGVMLGVLGALAGALLGALTTRADGHGPGLRGLAAGMAIGLPAGVIVALIGHALGLVQMLTPYVGGVTDVSPDGVAIQAQQGWLFVPALFGSVGLLAGGLAAAWRNERQGEMRGWSERLVGIGRALALATGVAIGLGSGLGYRFLGGPFVASQTQPNPAAGVTGMVIGMSCGAASVVAVLLLLHHPAREAWARSVALVAGGIVLALLPFWFVPLVGLG